MELVIEQGGAVVYGPTIWGPALRDEIGIANRDAPAVPYDLGGGRTLRQVTRVWPTVEWWQEIGAETSAVVDGAWQISRQVNDLPIMTVKAVQTDHMAAKRWAVETGGTTVNGMPVATDRDTQAKLIAVRILAKEDAAYTVTWKGPAGFVVLNAAAIIAIADAVSAHIQTAFAREAEVVALIEAATTLDEVKAIEW